MREFLLVVVGAALAGAASNIIGNDHQYFVVGAFIYYSVLCAAGAIKAIPK